MKKAYEKPYIHMQNFELSQQIASCQFIVRNQEAAGEGTCWIVNSEASNERIFSADSDCTVPGEAVCNYTATDAFPVFGSF